MSVATIRPAYQASASEHSLATIRSGDAPGRLDLHTVRLSLPMRTVVPSGRLAETLREHGMHRLNARLGSHATPSPCRVLKVP